ncbi:RNA-binding protein [Ordospora colligata]|uniref:Nuclear cap-binding protein subunit 2 n=1 Tax=Ordospora colligata OC4 TaxID=1354746 RepID=A0A0B2UM18_9MICR|nr:RNA-binding protein [Ordospora colligata OC4]KHN70112.1 RNA-binding protein [Ordospora colligata OC4]TBU16494.1 RNA-binding protein [Ordospora colligata]TBU16679.1 RNA-binding protein [Ordospora colligata]TBU19252.1 RNA-binding protein [Ordospora colligata]
MGSSDVLAKYFCGDSRGYFYREKTFEGTDEEYIEAKRQSSTVFVSNVSALVCEERIWELFLLCGRVRRVIMGLNRNTLRFCGFCFVEFYTTESADAAVKYLNGFRFEQSPLSIDKDYGFVDGRQYGRGMFGGRVKQDKLYVEERHHRDVKRGKYARRFR